jgi:hypothetical protein
MTTSYSNERSPVIAWALAGSVLLTALVAAFVCSPPAPNHLHSWSQTFSLATIYLLVAACVHAVAVWAVCRVREETESAAWTRVLSIIWAVWLVIVWLPLLVLLTAEKSPWVALVMPVTAVFALLLLRWRAGSLEPEPEMIADPSRQLLQLDEAPRLWRTLLPALGTALCAEVGLALLSASHAWMAGCLLGAGLVYPTKRWLGRNDGRNAQVGASQRASHRTSAANSVVVWLLMVLSLVPLMTIAAAGALNRVMHVQAHTQPHGASSAAKAASRGYVGVILIAPPKPHEIVPPTESTPGTSFKKEEVIPFDGVYWYFRQPDTQPGPTAHIIHGDPSTNRVFSTDTKPLTMEAHQRLGRPIAMSCCRSLRVDVRNADNVPGTISIEVLLRDTNAKKGAGSASLGTLILRSSTVSPMPLKRAPVDESLIFPLPASARGRAFNEITVRLKPERTRSLAGAQVAVKDFKLEP